MQKIIIWSFYLLFLLVPLVFNAKNYELFEYNKMMLTYAFTIIILTAWIIKSIINKKIFFQKTPLDIFLLLFLISQVASTIFSIDTHVSLFGYYSRFHQGLFATISYIILYYAFVTNFPKENIKKLLYFSFFSASIVSIWGIFEHFGHSVSCLIITGQFNVSCWVQDVATRVFATLGQPNWMSAYLAILIPISLGTANVFFERRYLSEAKHASTKKMFASQKINYFFIILSIIFYSAFLFTRSRSGFAALWIGLGIFATILIVSLRGAIATKQSQTGSPHSLRSLAMTLVCLLFLTFIFGSGIAQLDKFTLSKNFQKNSSEIISTGTSLETGGTESGQIRAIVWSGALDVFRHYPLFGSGVETFAFSYYQYRPQAHNMVSEWDFLYNKAHNEYLNFLATTGLFGFLAYMSFIIAFIFWFLKRIVNCQLSNSLANVVILEKSRLLELSLFVGWLTILITNFFGFSVVIVALYFYLIPAMVFINSEEKQSFRAFAIKQSNNIAIAIILIFSLLSIYKLFNFYSADIDYASALSQVKDSKYKEAYYFLTSALEKNPNEPVYHDEISTTLATLAIAFAQNKDTDSAKKFASLALKESDIATTISPNNVTFYKTKTKMFYILSQMDESFIARAVSALEKASQLSPTDPKIKYNLAILESKMNNIDRSITELETAVRLKPDYRDARYALALMYKDKGEVQKAKGELEYILNNLNPKDQEAQDKLNSWQ